MSRKSLKDRPLYSKDDVVYAPSFRADKQLIVNEVYHNGSVWMYCFKNDEASIGEYYLSRQLSEKPLRELLVDSIDKLKAIDNFNPMIVRWYNKKFQGAHVSEVEYWKLSGKDLLSFYELVLIQVYKTF